MGFWERKRLGHLCSSRALSSDNVLEHHPDRFLSAKLLKLKITVKTTPRLVQDPLCLISSSWRSFDAHEPAVHLSPVMSLRNATMLWGTLCPKAVVLKPLACISPKKNCRKQWKPYIFVGWHTKFFSISLDGCKGWNFWLRVDIDILNKTIVLLF